MGLGVDVLDQLNGIVSGCSGQAQFNCLCMFWMSSIELFLDIVDKLLNSFRMFWMSSMELFLDVLDKLN